MIDRGWRLIGTGSSFVLFGLGGLVLALLVFPVFRLFVRDRMKLAELAQTTVHRAWRLFTEYMRVTGTVTSEWRGARDLKHLHGTIVVANHPSLLDVVFLMSRMRRTRAVVKAGVWRNPFMAGVVSSANYIPNLGDPERLVEDCAQALRDGANLVIFPEGSRTPEGQPRKYQRGFAYAALAAGAPVQIVTIKVSPPTLRRGEPWYVIPPRRAHWVITVHERIDVAGLYGNDRSPAAVRALTAQVADRIEGLLRE